MRTQISNREVKGVTVIDLKGDVTIANGVNEFDEKVAGQLKLKNDSQIVVNLDGLGRFDSSLVGNLVKAHVTAERGGGQAAFVGLPKSLKTVLHTSKLVHDDPEKSVLTVFDTVDEAVDWFTSDTTYAQALEQDVGASAPQPPER